MRLEAAYGDTDGDREMLALAEEAGLSGLRGQRHETRPRPRTWTGSSDLLSRLRALGGLKEKKRGCFYFKSKGFLHFHEDPKGMFADLRQVDTRDDRRMKVDTEAGRAACRDALIKHCSDDRCLALSRCRPRRRRGRA